MRLWRVIPLLVGAIAIAPVATVQGAASEPAASVSAPSTLACKPVVNPYAGTRYEGVNLSKITATGVACGTARHVAREAHRKALEMPSPASGVRHLTWHRWEITGNLRPASDAYVAKLGAMRIRWRF